MEGLHKSLNKQRFDRKVGPNVRTAGRSPISLRHWQPHSSFPRQAEAPLDHNIPRAGVEKAILHGKNAYFFKTDNGSHAGYVFMTLIGLHPEYFPRSLGYRPPVQLSHRCRG